MSREVHEDSCMRSLFWLFLFAFVLMLACAHAYNEINLNCGLLDLSSPNLLQQLLQRAIT